MASLHEYRYGGEMVSGAAHFAIKAEERVHDVMLGNIDYQINFNNASSSLITYLAPIKHKEIIIQELGQILVVLMMKIICLTLLTEHL